MVAIAGRFFTLLCFCFILFHLAAALCSEQKPWAPLLLKTNCFFPAAPLFYSSYPGLKPGWLAPGICFRTSDLSLSLFCLSWCTYLCAARSGALCTRTAGFERVCRSACLWDVVVSVTCVRVYFPAVFSAGTPPTPPPSALYTFASPGSFVCPLFFYRGCRSQPVYSCFKRSQWVGASDGLMVYMGGGYYLAFCGPEL